MTGLTYNYIKTEKRQQILTVDKVEKKTPERLNMLSDLIHFLSVYIHRLALEKQAGFVPVSDNWVVNLQAVVEIYHTSTICTRLFVPLKFQAV